MTFADTLQITRMRKKLTQQQLAYIANVTNVTISQIENGQVQPNASTKEKIENIIGVVDWKRTHQEGGVKRQILTN